MATTTVVAEMGLQTTVPAVHSNQFHRRSLKIIAHQCKGPRVPATNGRVGIQGLHVHQMDLFIHPWGLHITITHSRYLALLAMVIITTSMQHTVATIMFNSHNTRLHQSMDTLVITTTMAEAEQDRILRHIVACQLP
ncbi:uncharacterized protein LOC118747852 [Rhagoletis pomonella]|uniref:uncharacterized protein LOC118747852 n=1 Tax=Rhagoletis pomonella TaxID=28610 RepID=UPI00177B9D33|nr:uncharacterized protein LOC118747852 [Rhagoletis pomonella]